MKENQLNFTQGSIPKQMIRFGVPLLLANLIQSCYNIADLVVVGRFVGSAGLAAVSNCSLISFIILSVCTGITMGGTVLIAQYRGAGKDVQVSRTIGTLFTLSLAASFLVTGLSLFFCRPLLQALQIPPEAMQYAQDYLWIFCAGTVFVFGYNAVCSVLRGLGDAKTPLWFVLAAGVINVVLDLLLVAVAGWGTAGAAFATVLSQGISCLLAVFSLRRKHFLFDFKLKSFAVNLSVLKQILKIGLPSAIQMAVINCSYLFVTGMLNLFGVSVSAAAGVGLKISTFAAMPCWAVGSAVTTMTGHNIGAGQMDRAAKVAGTGVWISVLAGTLTAFGIQLFAGPVIQLFNRDPQVVAEGMLYLRICCSFSCIPYAVMYTFDSFATGVGHAAFAMANACLDSVVMRLALSWVFGFGLGWGAHGIYWAQAISSLLPMAAGICYFVLGKWRRHQPASWREESNSQ